MMAAGPASRQHLMAHLQQYEALGVRYVVALRRPRRSGCSRRMTPRQAEQI